MDQDQKIVVIGRGGYDSEAIRDLVAECGDFDVELYASAAEALTRLHNGDLSLTVLNFELFNREKITILQQFRDLGLDFPTLIFGRVVAPDTYSMVEEFGNAILLEKPCEKKKLFGVIRKLVHGQSTGQPHYRRFYTDQPVNVETYDSATHVPGRIYNLSKGGAYIECETGGFHVGDMVRFSVRLSELAKRHIVSGRVVWSTGTGPQSGHPGFGVSFLKSGDVYQNMLKKL